ncbi:MAG: hypothetical protein KDA27_12640 [Candidatus Eisenbacteria bacterium]|uniref:Alginate export domain-containing protein n=1 Tax=Eiseniibacteriota bacterium TaxID=2212470 RepID=A0A956NCX8_UNCEI|nr:hypothetical protein [Candidatus Eisenbacteria bacterium]
MTRCLALPACAALLAISTHVAEAQFGLGDATQIQAANQFEFYYDTDVDESVLDDRLDVSASRGAFTVGVTFLSHSPSDPNVLDQNGFGPQVQGIRKRWFEVDGSDVRARVGDVYATFGRGLALQIFEDQTVDFDNVLDGFYGSISHGAFDLEVIGGSNSIGEPFQTLKGAQGTVAIPGGFTFGLEGVLVDPLDTGAGDPLGSDRLGGAFLGGPLGDYVDTYGEYVVRRYDPLQDDDEGLSDGHGAYANVTLYLGRLQILTEYKDFLRYVTENINPPTAFRSHTSTLLNRGSHIAALRFDDERGGFGEATLSLTDQTRLVGSWTKTEARHGYYPATEAYGEIEQWFGHSEIIFRMAETEEIIREGSSDIFFERITHSGTIVQPLSEYLSLDVTVETQGVQESNRDTQSYQFPLEYRDNIVSATLNKAPNMSWGLTYEWSDSPKEVDDAWLWADWNVQVGSRHQLSLGAGKLRGGQLCSGGVCKLVQPFEGVKLEFLTTF